MRVPSALLALIAIFAVTDAPSRVSAQDYPNRAITFIVPNLPGGSSDLIARTIGASVQKSFGQSVLIENKPGASEMIGTDLLVRAAPDGYTIAILSNALSINETLSPGRKYNTGRDLIPLVKLAELPFALIVNADVPAKSLQEFVAYAKANPGKLSYGHVGTGAPHYLTMEWFKREAGLNILPVPYRSTPPVFTAMLGGQIQVTVGALGGATQFIESGKVRALASMSRQRPASQPNLPTITESGYGAFDLVPWMGVFLPANVPAEIARKLEAALLAAAASDEVKGQFQRIGLEPSPSGSVAFGKLLQSDIGRWAKVIADVGVTPQ